MTNSLLNLSSELVLEKLLIVDTDFFLNAFIDLGIAALVDVPLIDAIKLFKAP